MCFGNICECVNTVSSNNSISNITTINHYACNAVAFVSSDSERLVLAAVCNITINIVSSDSTVFSSIYCESVGYLLECSSDIVVCSYISKCVNTVNNVGDCLNAVNHYACNSVAVVSRSNCDLLVITAIYCAGFGNCAVSFYRCCNFIGVKCERCNDCVICSHVSKCVNAVFINIAD